MDKAGGRVLLCTDSGTFNAAYADFCWRSAAKFSFDKPRPAPSFPPMATPEKKSVSPVMLLVDLVLTAVAFSIFYWLVNSHVPSNDPVMIKVWGGLGAACMTGVFWLALQMVKTVYRFQRDSRK